jgi:hypothetical protein
VFEHRRPWQLVHMVDQLTGRRFLIDTCASYSIFPHRSSSPLSGPTLTGANGQRIPCWGKRAVQLNFQGRRFKWTFLLPDFTFAIIGVDFLRRHKLLVDPAANRLVITASLQSFATVSAAASCAASANQSPPSPESPACTSGEAATCRRCRRCTLGRMRCWSEGRRCSGCRWGTERRQCQWTA